MPHGLTIDAEDNLWLTDVGRHQVRPMKILILVLTRHFVYSARLLVFTFAESVHMHIHETSRIIYINFI